VLFIAQLKRDCYELRHQTATMNLRVFDVSLLVQSSLRLWHRSWTGVVLLIEVRETL